MDASKSSFFRMLINIAKSIKDGIAKNFDKDKLVRAFFQEAFNHVQRIFSQKGVKFSDPMYDDIIDTTPTKNMGWVDLLRFYLNKAARDLATSVNLESFGKFLTTDFKKIFKLTDREHQFVQAAQKIGERIGKVLDDASKSAIFSRLMGWFAGLMASVKLKIVPNRNMIIETEFARENLEGLIRFGVKYDELMTIAKTMFDRLYELDNTIADQVEKNRKLKAQVINNITDANQRVNAAIDDGQAEFEKNMKAFESEIQKTNNSIG